MSINDLRSDLTNGVPLINLVEIISGGKSVNNGKYNKNPKVRTQMMENAGFALQFLKQEGLKLVNIGNEDIVDNNHKLILGLIWTIILRYQINISEGKSARNELLAWVRRKIPDKGIKNFDHDWNDGTAICHLVEALKQGLFPDLAELNPSNQLDNAKRGTEAAENNMGIPPVLAAEDMINPEVDELSVMTYIALFKEWEDKQAALKDTMDHGRTNVYGPGVEGGTVVRQPAPFTIEAKNAFGDKLTKGGDEFKVEVTGPKGKVPAQVTDNGDGTYAVEYTPSAHGTHTVTVDSKGLPVAKSPYTVEIDAGVDATKTKVSGPGVEKHSVAKDHPTYFTVHAHDLEGNPVDAGGAPFKAHLKTPSGQQEVPLKDNGDGTYRGEYQAKEVGPHEVTVDLEGAAVANSPYQVSVKELSDSSKTKVSGPGVQSSVPEGVPTWVDIHAHDSNGNPITTGHDHFTVKVKGPNGEQDAEVKDNGDGTYKAKFTPNGKGDTTVEVQNHGPEGQKHVDKSPYHINVREPADHTKSKVSGPGVVSGRPQGVPTHVDIEARDATGAPVGKGGDQFHVTVKGPNGDVPAKIVDNGDGHHRAEYTPTDLGDHTVEVTLAGPNGTNHVDQSPYHVAVRPAADASKTKVSGPGVRDGVAENVQTYINIEAFDAEGNKVTVGGDDYVVDVQGPSGSVPAQVQDNKDGTHTGTYTAKEVGPHTVTIKLQEKNVASSPYHLNVRERADASKSTAEGPGLVQPVQNVPTHFTVKAFDKEGKPVPFGGDEVKVNMKGPNGPVDVKVKDNEDGTYTAEYTPTEVGDSHIEVLMNGGHVGQSPYHVYVDEEADPDHSGLENFQFIIRAKRKDGVPKPKGGDKFEVKIYPEGDTNEGKEVEDVKFRDCGDGRYKVVYNLPGAGDYKVHITLNGKHITGSPWKQSI